MPSNLPWFATNGRIVDADGVLVCETSPEDAVAIVEAMAVWRAVKTLETAVQERHDLDARGSVLLDEHLIAEMGWGEVRYGPLLAALIALADEVER